MKTYYYDGEEIEVKPCPYCGGEGFGKSKELRYIGFNKITAEKRTRLGAYIYCGRCKARGGLAATTIDYTPGDSHKKCTYEFLLSEAIKNWNRRANEIT